jgi:flagellar biosynthesis regulator FlaF
MFQFAYSEIPEDCYPIAALPANHRLPKAAELLQASDIGDAHQKLEALSGFRSLWLMAVDDLQRSPDETPSSRAALLSASRKILAEVERLRFAAATPLRNRAGGSCRADALL